MVIGTKQRNEKMKVKRHKLLRSIGEYNFPKEAYIHDVTFDKNYMHVQLIDERVISIPLMWIPTLYNASDKDRHKFEISQKRTMIIWDSEKSSINDEINIVDYLEPTRADTESSLSYTAQESRKQIAEAKTKVKKK